MKQRLVWNFEFGTKTNLLPIEDLFGKKEDQVKWEIRFFWPNEAIITLNLIDNSLLDLANYQQKQRGDYYYLIPDCNYNIKQRHNQWLYKPLIKESARAKGFGAKIILKTPQKALEEASLISTDLPKLEHKIAKEGLSVYVKKEAFIYKFPTNPTVKLELARLEVLDKTYLTACIEGKSLDLVETISKQLLDEYTPCEYVSFLKNVLKS